MEASKIKVNKSRHHFVHNIFSQLFVTVFAFRFFPLILCMRIYLFFLVFGATPTWPWDAFVLYVWVRVCGVHAGYDVSKCVWGFLLVCAYACVCACACACVCLYDYHIAVSVKTLPPFEWWWTTVLSHINASKLRTKESDGGKWAFPMENIFPCVH